MNKPLLKALIAVATFGTLSLAHAEYPDRNLRIIVPIAAGSTTDYVARALADQLRLASTTPEETDAYVKAGIASISKTVKLAKIPVN